MFTKKTGSVLAFMLMSMLMPAYAVTNAGVLSQAEKEGLTFMREEEKLARDVYHNLFEKYDWAGFANIESSEQKHMDAILRLLIKYKLPDPAAGNLIGQFSNDELQSLYDLLMQKATDPAKALLVGGTIEETDIKDLVEREESVKHLDIKTTYENLSCGSRNHLRSFARAYTSLTGLPYPYGGVLTTIILDPAMVASIITSSMEQCGGN